MNSTSAIAGLLLLIATSAAAADETTLAKRVEPHPSIDIDTICARSPQQCLVKIEKLLVLEPVESRRWFQYKNYQLDALFELERSKQLSREIKPWLTRDDIPLKFKISLLIYSAKTLPKSQHVLANEHMSKAIELLEQVSEVNHNPLILVQIANSLNQQGEYQRGYQMLKPLADKYQNRHMPRFQTELYANLGHFAYRLNKFEEHVNYRLLALKWARLWGNENQVGISLYNVARAYQISGNYTMALDYLLQAEQLRKHEQNEHILINFRRAEIALAQGHLDKAESYYAEVAQEVEAKHYQQLFTEFESALMQATSMQAKDTE